jgi:hypothetical protein
MDLGAAEDFDRKPGRRSGGLSVSRPGRCVARAITRTGRMSVFQMLVVSDGRIPKTVSGNTASDSIRESTVSCEYIKGGGEFVYQHWIRCIGRIRKFAMIQLIYRRRICVYQLIYPSSVYQFISKEENLYILLLYINLDIAVDFGIVGTSKLR